MPAKSADRGARKSAKPERARPRPDRKARAKATAANAGSHLTASQKIDQHIESIADWRGEVLASIRRIMREADPAVTEDWKWMGSPVWYCDGMIALANAHKDKVKVTFAKGAHLTDADGLFNAGFAGNEWRAIDLFEKDRLDEAALLRLIRTAIAYNRSQPKGKERTKAVQARGKSKRCS